MIVRASAMILEDFAVEKPVACSATHIEHALKISPTVQERRRGAIAMFRWQVRRRARRTATMLTTGCCVCCCTKCGVPLPARNESEAVVMAAIMGSSRRCGRGGCAEMEKAMIGDDAYCSSRSRSFALNCSRAVRARPGSHRRLQPG